MRWRDPSLKRSMVFGRGKVGSGCGSQGVLKVIVPIAVAVAVAVRDAIESESESNVVHGVAEGWFGSESSIVRSSGSRSDSKKEWLPRRVGDAPDFKRAVDPWPTIKVDVGKSRGSPTWSQCIFFISEWGSWW